MLELLQQIFQTCVIPLLGILTAYIVKLIKTKSEEISSNTTNATAQKYIDMITETAQMCVITTNQTYVNSLKAEDKFDAEAQKTAFKLTYDAIIATLSDETKKYITETSGDLTVYLTQVIESQVNQNK